ncbi:MAG TPA: hypothetical protein VLI05_01930 [Candidatus Saccharimonadia bacterium]|nr:hypothetical protein [Candidatus Saccharimonadia bacterium]
MTRSTPRVITTVLLDMGGVLTSDILERVMFDRRYGVGPRGWLARRRWWRAAAPVWRRYALGAETNETDFWAAISAATGLTTTPAVAEAVRRHTMQVNTEADQLLPALRAAGLRVGVVSDNVAFWYPRQLAALGPAAQAAIDPELVFLSYRLGRQKCCGLYAAVARVVDPATTLVVDDRAPYRQAARRAGFRVAAYHLAPGASLTAALQRHGVWPAAQAKGRSV